MPLTKKGKKVMAAMKASYGAKKGEKVFYASRNKGVIKGVERNIPGMSKHYVVNCNEHSRKKSVDMGSLRAGEKKDVKSHF